MITLRPFNLIDLCYLSCCASFSHTITSYIFLGLKAFFNQKEFPFTDLTFTTNNIYAILNQKRDLELEVDSMQCFMCNKNQKTMIKFMATQHIHKKKDSAENRWTCCSSVFFLEKVGERIQGHLTVTIGNDNYESLTTGNDKNRLLAGTNEALRAVIE